MDKKQDTSFQFKQLPKKTIEIIVNIPWTQIEKIQESVIEDEGRKIEIKGFRKGMAPNNLIKQALGNEKLLRLILEKILPDYFEKAIQQLKLKPITSPKVELLSTKERQDWQAKFITCEEPEVNLGNYKEEIKKLIKEPAEIWTPESKKEEKPEEKKNTREEKINNAIEWLIKNIKIGLSDLLIENEVTRKLSSLLEQTQKLGLTIDQYLASIGKSIEAVKEEYSKQAQDSLALEFILGKIADKENIQVTEEDLNKAIANAKSDEEKKAIESQKYYLAVLLRRQKTLDFLANL